MLKHACKPQICSVYNNPMVAFLWQFSANISSKRDRDSLSLNADGVLGIQQLFPIYDNTDVMKSN